VADGDNREKRGILDIMILPMMNQRAHIKTNRRDVSNPPIVHIFWRVLIHNFVSFRNLVP
jgi:hypothetical protein